MNTTLRRRNVLAIASLLCWLPAAAPAEPEIAPGDSVALPTAGLPPVVASTDSLLALVPMRVETAIRVEIAQHEADIARAREDAATASRLQERAAADIAAKKAALDEVQVHLNAAKKAKDAVAKSEWESRKRLLQLERGLLERRAALRGKEIEYAEAQEAASVAAIQACRIELELQLKRDQRAALQGRDLLPDLVEAIRRADRELDDAEKATLDAQIKVAERRRDVAAREVDLAKSKKRVLDAQIKWLRGS